MTPLRKITLLCLSALMLSGCSNKFSQPTSAACIERLEVLAAAHSEEVVDPEVAERNTEHIDCVINQNDRYAYSLLGQTLYGEAKTDKELKKAAKVLKQAAMPDNGYTQIYIAAAGSVPAQTQGIKTRPATAGDADAQYLLGWMYLKGLGVGQSDRKAKKWLKRAAGQGHQKASELLVDMAKNERG